MLPFGDVIWAVAIPFSAIHLCSNLAWLLNKDKKIMPYSFRCRYIIRVLIYDHQNTNSFGNINLQYVFASSNMEFSNCIDFPE